MSNTPCTPVIINTCICQSDCAGNREMCDNFEQKTMGFIQKNYFSSSCYGCLSSVRFDVQLGNCVIFQFIININHITKWGFPKPSYCLLEDFSFKPMKDYSREVLSHITGFMTSR